ncbi:MAG: S8 family serine peptidase [Candidatus Eiseniibacteriota bacterium]
MSERNGSFEVDPGKEARDLRVVVARFPFDPSGWTALPEGSAWTIIPAGTGTVALEPLGLAEGTEANLWWTVVWTDSRTGALRAGDVRTFTLLPRFANRVGPDGLVRPNATGRLARSAADLRGTEGPRRAIQLASGVTLEPDGPTSAPELARLRRTAADDGTTRSVPERGAYLVQFADGSPDSAKARIATAGGTLAWPIAGDGYVVRLEADELARLAASGGEPWIAPYEPVYRMSPDLRDTTGATGATGTAADVTALLFDDADTGATLDALRALGAVGVALQADGRNRLVRFELDRTRLEAAAALTDVAWIEPTPKYEPHNRDAQWVIQSGVPDFRPVTGHGLRGQGQILMVSDSGIRANHEMFDDPGHPITDWGDFPTHRKIVAYKPGTPLNSLGFGDDLAFDYHGTHTSGTVAGDPSPTSAAPWAGLAPAARLYFMDVGSGGPGRTFTLPSDLNDLFRPSYDGNAAGRARISSNSWGQTSSLGAYTLTSMQVDQFAWDHPDYLIAYSVGNVGVFASAAAPSTAKNCLTVGATGNGTEQNQLAPFSSRGPTRDGRRKPTVVAPGNPVVSSIGSTRYSYAGYGGTSMATPAVAGAMALVRQYLTEGWYPTGAPVAANAFEPSAALLRAMAVAAARNDVVSFRAPDNSIGYGRLTIDDVLHFPGDPLRTLLVDPTDGLGDLEYVEYTVNVTDPSVPLKIALCWTDAPGSPASQIQLVNDLDLVVTHGGQTYRGNYLLNGVSIAGGVRDTLNVEEFVRLATPGPGQWTVRIEGRRVVQGPQRFALCITGGVGGPAGAIALDRFQYGLTDTIAIEVIDTNGTGPLAVRVLSGSEPAGEVVTLTGSNGVFRGSLPIAPIPGYLASDGILAVSSDDIVTAAYVDISPFAQAMASARINVQAPTISSVHATSLGATRALVTWTTDIAATSRVRFGAGVLGAVADSGGHTTQHAVLLTGLAPETTYRYDVESSTPGGDVSTDSLGGAHRSFTTASRGSIALLMDDPNPDVLATWSNAFAALGWEVDVLPAAGNDPPLVGNSSVGLRSYQAVLWQVDPDRYPPFSDAQRTAIDSLLEGGGRLLVTGHDIGFGLSDAGAPSYSPEREAWIESGLKTRYYFDNIWADTLAGIAGNPVSGAYTDSIPYAFWLYADSGDNVGPAPGTDGLWIADWVENFIGSRHMGMHWESNSPRGTAGVGVWGGQRSRLVGQFFEWRALAGASTSHHPTRTAVLADAVSWLLEHRPPQARLVEPAPGSVVTTDVVTVRYSILPDAGRAITARELDYSIDGGESWAPVTNAASTDSGWTWDLTGALGGSPTPNSTRMLLRLRVADDGTPSLQTTALMSAPFTVARSGGDTQGPALVGGSASVSPVPIRPAGPNTLFARFSDAETGGGTVVAAEYSIGASPVPAGSGVPMSASFGTPTVQASAVLATAGLGNGSLTFWMRARDAAGNWGEAIALIVPTSLNGTVAAEDAPAIDFLATPSPNPFRERASIRFGLARAGDVRLELFDVAGRRVRTLVEGAHDAGTHVALWNGRDEHGRRIGAGVYFVRLVTPGRTFHARLVALD